MKNKMKRFLGLLLSLTLVLGLFPGMSMTAYAASINAFGGQSVTISSDQTCTGFDVLDGSTLTVNQGVTLTLNMNDGHSFHLFDNSNLELHGTLAGSVGSGATWMDNTYINVYLSDGAKYTVTGLSCMDGDNYLRYYGYDAATDGNGTVSVMNGTTDVTASSIGYKTTTYTFTATPSSGYRFVSWTKGASGEVLGTDASINVTCEQNGQYQVYANFEVAHTHSFTYSASGDTITATCSVANCTLTDSKATLTIAAPALTTYGGTGDATATLTGLSDFNTATGKTIAATDIKYVGRDSTTYEESTTAPTDAGKYTAKITVEDKTASVDYEIAKADPTATAPTATATYGQTLADVTLNNPDGNTAGTWAWVDSTTSVGTVGEHTFKANFTPTDTTNYNSKSNVDVTVTVGKAANPATVTSTASVTKGGNTVDLANNVTKNGATGAVSYEISGEANGCSLNGSVLTSGSNTGSVTVNVTIAEDSNYNALAATPITVTISDKGTQTISAEPVTATYGDTDKSVSATVTDPATGGGAISYAVKDGSADYIDVDASTGALTIKKVGTATVIVTAAETSTYAQATKDVTVTINKANAVAATVTANNRTYDGTEKPLVTVTGEATGGTMVYALGENATTAPAAEQYTTSIPTATDAGTYYVWYKAVGDDNHNDSNPASVEVTVSAADPTAPTNLTATYGQTLANVTLPTSWAWAVETTTSVGNAGTNTFKANYTSASTNYNSKSNVDVSVTVSAADPTTPTGLTATYGQTLADVTLPDDWAWADSTTIVGDAGTKNFKANYTAPNANYNSKSNVDVSVTVEKANTVAATVTANNRTYDRTEKPLVTVDDSMLLGGTMNYAVTTENTAPTDDNLYTTSIPAKTGAGTYYVWSMVKGDGNHKDSTPTAVVVSIEKADIHPVVTIKSWKVDAYAQTPQVTGNTENGKVTYTYSVKGENNYQSTVPESAGLYTVKASIEETANYRSGEAVANFSIMKERPNTVTWDTEVLKNLARTTGDDPFTQGGVTLEVLNGTARYSNGVSFNGFGFKEDSFRFLSDRYITEIKITGKVRSLKWTGAEKSAGGLVWTGSSTSIDFGKQIESVEKIEFTLGDYPKEMPEADFVTPGALKWIDEEAFEGIAARNIRISDGTKGLGSRAFADCPNLKTIFIPESVEAIPDDLLDGCRDVKVYGTGDKTRTFAENNGHVFIQVQ